LASGPPYPTEKNKLADPPSKEDIERVAYCAGVYLASFSKEPFDEKWSIDGCVIPGLLLNPRTTGHFVKAVFHQDDLKITASPDGGEHFNVNKELLLNYLEETLSDPMTSYLCDAEWFSKTDIESLARLKNKISTNNDKNIDVYIPYPVTNILSSYVEAIQGAYSIVSLGFHETWEYKPAPEQKTKDNAPPTVSNEVKLLRITPDTIIPDDVYPRLCSRYLGINHPGNDKREDVAEIAIRETEFYLNKSETDVIKEKVEPNVYTSFLGEVAKIPDNDYTLSGMHWIAIKYLEILTTRNEITADYEVKDLLPKQLLYLSLPGTAVSSKSKIHRGESRLMQTLRFFYNPVGLEIEEEVLSFPKPDGQTVLFGIIKQV